MKRIKKVKGCGSCRSYRQYYCAIAGVKKKIPLKVFNKGCPQRKKAKIYF